MKIFFGVIIFLLVQMGVFAQEGTHFESIFFQKAMEKAKTEKKLIFMDCYTSWCGPCQMMLKDVFPQPKVGEFLNSHFVNVKYDMEKGEGRELLKKYGVKAFPTFLIIQPDGTLQHKIVGGYMDCELFIQLIKRGMNKKSSLVYLEECYEKGKASKQELLNYAYALLIAGENERYGEVRQKLAPLLTADDRLQKPYWLIIERAKYPSEDFHFFATHAEEYRQLVGREKVDYLLNSVYNAAIARVMWSEDQEPLKTLNKIEQELQTLSFPKQKVLLKKIELNRLQLTKNWEQLVLFMEDFQGGMLFWEITEPLSAGKSQFTDQQLKRIIVLKEKFCSIYAKEQQEVEAYFDAFQLMLSPKLNLQSLTYEKTIRQAMVTLKKIALIFYSTEEELEILVQKLEQENLRKKLNADFICLSVAVGSEGQKMWQEQCKMETLPSLAIVNWQRIVEQNWTVSEIAEMTVEELLQKLNIEK